MKSIYAILIGLLSPVLLFSQNSSPEIFYSTIYKRNIECFSDSSREVFTIVEEMPSFPGGFEAATKFIQSNRNKCDVTGKVFVTFVVDTKGEIHCTKVLRGISETCNEEAMRVIRSMPRWNPGKQRGEAVEVQFTLKVEF